jgi:hypothetical protein
MHDVKACMTGGPVDGYHRIEGARATYRFYRAPVSPIHRNSSAKRDITTEESGFSSY